MTTTPFEASDSPLLSPDDFRLISEAFAGKIDQDSFSETYDASTDANNAAKLVIQGVIEAGREFNAPDMKVLVEVPDNLDTFKGTGGLRKSPWLVGASLALGLSAIAIILIPFQQEQNNGRQRGVAYSLSQARTRGDVTTNSSVKQEWVLRLEQSEPAIGYIVRSDSQSISLEPGSFELPQQNRYLIRFREDDSQYHLLLIDPAGDIERKEIEMFLGVLSSNSEKWKEDFLRSLSHAGVKWYALSEIVKPTTQTSSP